MTADVKQRYVLQGVDRTQGAFRAMRKRIEELERRLKKLEAAGSRVNSSFSRFATSVGGFYAALAGGRQAIHALNTLEQMDNRLRVLTDNAGDLGLLRARLIEISLDTRQHLPSVVQFYGRLAFALRDTNVTQEQVLDITTTLNKLIVASGAGAREATSAMIQLAQAMASGRLSGEEFRSVSEQLPVVLEAIQAYTGKTRGELIKMAHAQEITSEIVLNALAQYREEANVLFGKTNVTVEQGWNKVTTAAYEYTGQVNRATQLTLKMANALTVISENFRFVANTALAAMIVGIGAAVVKFDLLKKAAIGARVAMRGFIPLLAVEGLIYGWQALNGEFDNQKNRVDDLLEKWGDYKKLQDDIAKQRQRGLQDDLALLAKEEMQVKMKMVELEAHLMTSMKAPRGLLNKAGANDVILEELAVLQKRVDEITVAASKMIATLSGMTDDGEIDVGLAVSEEEKNGKLSGWASVYLDALGGSGQSKQEELMQSRSEALQVWADIEEEWRRNREEADMAHQRELGESHASALEEWEERERLFWENRLFIWENGSARQKELNEGNAQAYERYVARVEQLEAHKASILSSGFAIAKAVAGKNEKLQTAIFVAMKAVEVAKAIMAAHAASALALAQPPGPPVTIPLAAAALKAGYWNAAAIAATAIGQVAGGGGGGGGSVGAIGSTAVTTTEPILDEDEDGGATRNITIAVKPGLYDRQSIVDLARQLAEVYEDNRDVNLTFAD